MLVDARLTKNALRTIVVLAVLALSLPAFATATAPTPVNACVSLAVTVSPPSATVAVGSSVDFTATVMCGSDDVTAKSQISWTLASSNLMIGKISPLDGPKTTFTAAAPGQGTLVATAYYQGSNSQAKGQGTASILVGGGTVVCSANILTVVVDPTTATLAVGGTQAFTVQVFCGNQDVTSQASIAWMVTTTIGFVAPISGPKTLFTAATPGTGDVVASASLPNGMSGRSTASVTVTGGGSGCNVLQVDVNPSLATLAVGGQQTFGATVWCGGQDVTGATATSISWTVTGGIGSVSPTSGPKTSFSATTPGNGEVIADATYQGAAGRGLAAVTVTGGGGNTCVQLSVHVSPQNIYTFVGTMLKFAATVDCDGKDVTSAATIGWSVWGGIGTASPASGAGTVFTATTPGYGALFADATFNGQTARGGARITVAGQSAVCLQMSVVLTPGKVAMMVGDVQRFDARVYCNNVDVTSKATITWALVGNIGALSGTGGPTTDLAASTAGQGAVIAMATLGGMSELGYAMVVVT